jgi:hypothetical protein
VAENRILVAYCGLYCGACSFRVAAQESDRQHLEAMPSKYDSYKDAPLEVCSGCRQESGVCGHGIRECARNRALGHCGACPEFPCARIREFNDDGIPHHTEAIANLERLKRVGEEAWLADQERNWTCVCGARFSWYRRECPKCGTKADAVGSM